MCCDRTVTASYKRSRVIKIKGEIQMRANEIDIQKVFTKKLAIELRKRGFKIIGTEPNYKYPQFDVYFFKKTPELQQAIHDINSK